MIDPPNIRDDNLFLREFRVGKEGAGDVTEEEDRKFLEEEEEGGGVIVVEVRGLSSEEERILRVVGVEGLEELEEGEAGSR